MFAGLFRYVFIASTCSINFIRNSFEFTALSSTVTVKYCRPTNSWILPHCKWTLDIMCCCQIKLNLSRSEMSVLCFSVVVHVNIKVFTCPE